MKSITHKTLALVAMLIGLAIVVTNVSAQSQSAPYRLIDLGTLPGHDTGGAFDINNRGQVVGRSGDWKPNCENGECTAVLWENGTVTDLGTLPYHDYSEARAINNQGEIVGLAGSWDSGQQGDHAVRWDNGFITDLGMPSGGDVAIASGINERGQIIGAGAGESGQYGLLWDNGTITKLEAMDVWIDDDTSPVGRLGPLAAAYGINNRGQIVGVSTTETGVHAVLWENGTVTDLGTLPDHNYSEAFGINERGQIMGLSGMWTDDCNAGQCNAVLWENGTIMDLGIPMTAWGLPSGINNPGQIVFGSFQSYLDGDAFIRAVFWDNGTITDLGALAPGSGLSAAFGNNDRGQIVGFSVAVGGRAALWTR
jgi:probable HAF family extracellular repeat protein